jgi:tRNA(fMet)-specific endonuclease VapC
MDADIMIAAVALSNNLILVTNNEKHFNRIPDLNIENWLIIGTDR